MLVGRTVQGAAGGLLAGLGYAVINTALPSSLWTKASALVSAMWGVGTLVGPAAGGLFAQYGSWRWAFGVLVVLTAAMASLVPIALPGRRTRESRTRRSGYRDPGVVAAAARRGRAVGQRRGHPARRPGTAALVAAGVALVAVFVVVDRRMPRCGVAAQRVRAGSAEVDLPDARRADGRHDGGHVRAAVRSAAGPPDARWRRVSSARGWRSAGPSARSAARR